MWVLIETVWVIRKGKMAFFLWDTEASARQPRLPWQRTRSPVEPVHPGLLNKVKESHQNKPYSLADFPRWHPRQPRELLQSHTHTHTHTINHLHPCLWRGLLLFPHGLNWVIKTCKNNGTANLVSATHFYFTTGPRWAVCGHIRTLTH